MEKDPIQNNQSTSANTAKKTPWDALVLNSEGPNKNDYLNATRKEEYLASKSGHNEVVQEEYLDLVTERLDKEVEDGTKTREEANKELETLLDDTIESIDSIRKREYDRQHQELLQKMANIHAQVDEAGEQKILDIKQQIIAKRQPETTTTTERDDNAGDIDNPVVDVAPTNNDKNAATQNPAPTIVAPAPETASTVEPVSESETETEPETKAESEPEIVQPTHEVAPKDEIQEIRDSIAKNDEEIKQARAAIEKSRKEFAELKQKYLARQLVGVDADFSHDRETLIKDRASNAYATEKSGAGFFKRARMNFFENYYKKKYAKEIDAGKRKITVDGKEMTLDEALADRSEGAIGRFVSSIAENDLNYLYGAQGMDGESRKVDPVTTKAVRAAILEYAKKRGAGADEKIFKEQLHEKLKAIQSESNEPDHFNNYFEVAENAIKIKDMARGTMSLEQVLENFKVYNAKVRESYSSETRKENVANILAALKRNGFRGIVKSDKIIVAAESATLLTKSGLLTTFNAWDQPSPAPETPTTKAATETAPASQPAPATTETTTTASTPAPEAQPKNRDEYYGSYKNLIGEDGVKFFSAIGEDISKPETQKKFGNWWNSLSYEGKRAAFDLAVDQDGPSSGNAIKMWIRFNTQNLPPTPTA